MRWRLGQLGVSVSGPGDQGLPERRARQDVAIVAASPQHLDGRIGSARLRNEARLADAGLAGDEHGCAPSALRKRHELGERGQLALPTDVWRRLPQPGADGHWFPTAPPTRPPARADL